MPKDGRRGSSGRGTEPGEGEAAGEAESRGVVRKAQDALEAAAQRRRIGMMDETARRAIGEGEPWIDVRARANCAIGQVQVCRVRGCRNFRRNVINPAIRIREGCREPDWSAE